ncbi:RND transporter [Azospira sp. I13]|uniref:efflux RND transporter periplasmic adaptor subunit n=1 Tax=Azospira sp. I13 TaxID=1765050 RepID=UPI000D490433|nr:efflux RND transporter periplasmic adaptor subunit [Azospira sp. I13]GBG01983.1 RND transporter [Azospira sp. I13]
MKSKPIAIALGAVLLGGALVYSLLPRKDAGDGKGAKPVPVKVAQAVSADMPVTLSVIGRAEAYESVTLKARVDAQVLAVPFVEGQRVKKGEVLVRLDPATFAAQLRQAEAAQARDQAQLAKARLDVQRYQELRTKGFISEEKLNEVKANADALAATVQAGGAAAELARLQHSFTTVTAPFAGVVGAKQVHPGALVKNNDTVLAVVNRVRPLHITFTVPEKYLPRLKESLAGAGLQAEITVPGSNAPAMQGPVRFVDNAVDASTGTIQLKAVLENEQEALTPGQFVNVSLVLQTLAGAVVVPAEAIQQGQEGSFIYVVQADKSVQPKAVTVAASQGRRVAVSGGVAAGDTVVTDGQLRLTPGTKIEAAAEATTPAPAAAPTAAKG